MRPPPRFVRFLRRLAPFGERVIGRRGAWVLQFRALSASHSVGRQVFIVHTLITADGIFVLALAAWWQLRRSANLLPHLRRGPSSFHFSPANGVVAWIMTAVTAQTRLTLPLPAVGNPTGGAGERAAMCGPPPLRSGRTPRRGQARRPNGTPRRSRFRARFGRLARCRAEASARGGSADLPVPGRRSAAGPAAYGERQRVHRAADPARASTRGRTQGLRVMAGRMRGLLLVCAVVAVAAWPIAVPTSAAWAAADGPGFPRQGPSTQAPSTQAPDTQAPSTQAPDTHAPSTKAPSTQSQHRSPRPHPPPTHSNSSSRRRTPPRRLAQQQAALAAQQQAGVAAQQQAALAAQQQAALAAAQAQGAGQGGEAGRAAGRGRAACGCHLGPSRAPDEAGHRAHDLDRLRVRRAVWCSGWPATVARCRWPRWMPRSRRPG